jgi:3-keto-disaccharide hydrolase
MKRLLMAVGLVALLMMSLDIARSSGGDKNDKGWVQLFNGKDLTGWKLHPEPNKGAIVEVIKKEESGKLVAIYAKLKNGKEVPLWRVEEGILIGSGPASHLFSKRGDYQNFYYRVEAMINDKGNSGQYFRTAFGPGFPQGYEAQINATHGDPVRTGSLYPAGGLGKYRKEITVLNKAPHKPNEWFTQEVIANGNHIIIKVNGKTTVDWKDPENRYTKGHFALQGHDPGTVVKFKKIEVKELPASKN